MKAKYLAVIAAAIALVVTGTVVVAGAVSSVVLARAPYVTDLTTTTAYVNWATEATQRPGSVIVQPETGSSCPTSISWSATKHPFASPTADPLVANGGTTVPWNFTVVSTTEWQASTPVTGLKPDTTYCYAVYPSATSAFKQLWATQSFTTLALPSSTTPVTFDVVGDTGETQSAPGVEYPNDLNPGEQAIYQEIGNSGARFLVMPGDVSYSGGTENTYGDLKQPGPDQSDIFGPSYLPLAKGIPAFVADGNHGQTSDDLRIWPQVRSVKSSAGQYGYGAPPAGVDGITSNSPSDWYAIQTGDVRIYVLDAAWADSSASQTGTATGSECPASYQSHCLGYQADADEHWQTTSTEYQWLASDLAAHPGGVKMAVFHYPVRSVNQTEGSDPYLSGLDALLTANGVKVAFNGHAHTYQRFVPNDGSLATFVTGGGGGILEPVDTAGDKGANAQCNPMLAQATVYAIGWNPTATASPGSECSSGNVAPTPTSPMQVFNFLKVTVNGSQVTVQAINGLNQVFDSATFSYAAPDTQAPSVPTGLATTSVTAGSVGLAWNPSSDNVGTTGYNVLRDGTKVGSTTTASFTDPTVAPGSTYQYSVEAFDAAGNTSVPSTQLPVTTLSGPPPAVTFVQGAGSVTKTVTLSQPAGAGDLLVLAGSLYTGATRHITAISSGTDTWKQALDSNATGHNSDGELWYAIAGGGETAITVTTAASNVALGVQEFAGIGANPTVTAAGAANTGTTASAGTSGTGLAVGFVAGHASNQAIAPSGPFASQSQQTTPSPFASLVAGNDLAASGSVAYGGTFATAMYWTAGVAVFTP